jgi:holo-[acyl-carrier protein] synthase
MRIQGIGTEIVECLRIAQMIERYGEQFIEGILTSEEIQFCASRKHSTQQYAAHWATKKAVLKALDTAWTRDFHWRDIVIRVEGGAEPRVKLLGELSELANRRGVTRLLATYAHCRTHATAYVLAIQEPSPGGRRDVP